MIVFGLAISTERWNFLTLFAEYSDSIKKKKIVSTFITEYFIIKKKRSSKLIK